MNVLGINAAYHESAAALVVDGRLVSAAEEERFNRVKHGKLARIDNLDELPLQSIRYCLAQANLPAHRLDAVAYSFAPTLRRTRFRVDELSQPGDWGSLNGEARFLSQLDALPTALARALNRPLDAGVLHWVPHHLAHAASAYHSTGWRNAAVLVIDGIGEADTGLTAVGRNGLLQTSGVLPYPNSLGFLWEKLCRFLGFSEYDACKVMGMAAYGDPAACEAAFSQFAAVNVDGSFTCDAQTLRFRLDDNAPLESLLGPARVRGGALEHRHYDIAAALQAFTERALLAIAARLRSESGLRDLCYAGGVALNCTANRRLLDANLFERIFIPSAPHDAGTAIGAAWQVAAQRGERDASPSNDPYLGPAYDDTEMEQALRRVGLRWERVAAAGALEARVARMLAGGAIVGWFQGRMEFGPRALGNRSLLADPRRADSRARMNALVKRRESFRPFAPSVLAEKAAAWFELGTLSAAHDLMLVTCPALPARRAEIPAVLHVDGTSRLQLVRHEGNPRFHALISAFDAITGVPLLLNTSFNDSEPIVCSPDDAVRTFLNSPIDALAIGDYLVTTRSCEATQ